MIKRSLTFEPENPRVQAAMAILSVFRNDIPDAEKHFREAIKAEPFNPTYHVGLGTALCQQGKWIEGLEQFVAFQPSKDNQELVDRQEKMTMTQITKQLGQGKTFDARGWLAIGIYYAKIGEQDKAIDAFYKTLKLNPNQTDAWFNLGSLNEAGHNWPEARKAYQKLLSLKDITEFQKDFVVKHLSDIGNR
jgi:tetratricopeptide (TPR) repeat protein